MPKHKPQFENNEIYHIYNRGVEKRNVFTETRDYFRFINSLSEFNDINPALPSNVRYAIRNPSKITSQNLQALCLEVQPLNIGPVPQPLIEILAFCLMPNHYHLLAKQLVNNGVVKFMHKLGTGYTVYFNQKNERVGSLFQGRFKAVLIEREEHLNYLPLYIHLNPLDLTNYKWREGKLRSPKEALDFLADYKWSSYNDYINNRGNFSSVIKKDLLLDVFGGKENIKKSTLEFINSLKINEIQDLTLE